MSRYETCPKCKGTGFYTTTCPACNGTGIEPYPNYEGTEICVSCHGEGVIHDAYCPKCYASGTIERSDS